jgi:hypothetical protein
METITIQVTLASGEIITLELSGAVASQHVSSKEVTFTCSGDVSLKVVDPGNRVTHVQAVPTGQEGTQP